MWSRRAWLHTGASAWLTASVLPVRAQLPGLASPPPASRAPLGQVVMAMDHRDSFCYLPLTIAERLGFFVAEGLDLQIREFGQPEQVMQALLSGSVQVASSTLGQAIRQQAQGHDVRSFVLQGRTPQLVLGVSQRTLSNYRQLADLKGGRLGVTALGSASHGVARLMLGRAGLTPQDVSFQVFDDAAVARQAFRSGQLDALCYHDPLVTQLEQDGALRVVADTRTLRGNADVFGGPLPTACLCASAAFIDQHAARCQAMANALVRALKWLQTAGPSDLIRTIPEPYFHGDRSLYLAAFSRAREAWVPDGLMPSGGPQTLLRTLARFGDAQALQRVDLAQAYTDRFAREAKQRWRA